MVYSIDVLVGIAIFSLSFTLLVSKLIVLQGVYATQAEGFAYSIDTNSKTQFLLYSIEAQNWSGEASADMLNGFPGYNIVPYNSPGPLCVHCQTATARILAIGGNLYLLTDDANESPNLT